MTSVMNPVPIVDLGLDPVVDPVVDPVEVVDPVWDPAVVTRGGVGLPETVEVVVGVDTHEQFHVAAAVAASSGAVLAVTTIETSEHGYVELVEFADQYSGLRAWAIEGTASHGAGLTRHLTAAQEVVRELDRPERAKRWRGEKSDAIDAIRAAREALARPRLAAPKAGGVRQALAVLMVARRTAVGHATDAERQLRNLILNGPAPLRAKFTGKTLPQMVTTAARLRVPTTSLTASPEAIELGYTIKVVHTLARRAQALRAEALVEEKEITKLVASWRPDLLEELGIGPIVAATVLCAWSHPGRIHSEAAFAMLAGAAPLLAASGAVQDRHRLNRSGNRQLNRALHTIVLTRQRHDPATKSYTQRRTTQGKNPREIRRCLKRYLARNLYRLLEHPHPLASPLDNP